MHYNQIVLIYPKTPETSVYLFQFYGCIVQRSIHLLGHSYIATSSHHTQFPLKHHQLPEAKKDKSRIHCLRFTGKKSPHMINIEKRRYI